MKKSTALYLIAAAWLVVFLCSIFFFENIGALFFIVLAIVVFYMAVDEHKCELKNK
jgi:hypothetical protein